MKHLAIIDRDGIEAVPVPLLAALVDQGMEPAQIAQVEWTEDGNRIDARVMFRAPIDAIDCTIEVP